jgi:hypothetical protein
MDKFFQDPSFPLAGMIYLKPMPGSEIHRLISPQREHRENRERILQLPGVTGGSPGRCAGEESPHQKNPKLL